MTKQEFLNDLYKKCGLTSEDTFKHPSFGFTIITRSGIEKVQAAYDIEVDYELLSKDLDNIIIKATAVDKNEKTIQSFGEASPKNTKQTYPVAIAEKRALSRVVLKMTGAYAHGVFGEDESDDFKDERAAMNTKQLSNMKDAIQRGEMTADEAFEKAEDAGLIVPESIKYSYRKLKAQRSSGTL